MKLTLQSVLAGIFLLFALAHSAFSAIPAERVFIQNKGQWNNAAAYRLAVGLTADSPGRSLELWLTKEGYVYHISEMHVSDERPGGADGGAVAVSPETFGGFEEVRQHAVFVRFIGSDTGIWETREEQVVPGAFNWLNTRDASRQFTGVGASKRVIYRNVYSGIDVMFDAVPYPGMMETTFVVTPGANPEKILFRCEGADAMYLDATGSLVLRTSLGDIIEQKPVAFQHNELGEKEPVSVAFVLRDKQVGFQLGVFDSSRPLHIDPTVVFSRTFGGASSDSIAEMHEDGTGRYLTGMTISTDFPATSGAFQTTSAGNYDLFAAKFDVSNQNLLWATYIGTSASESGGHSALASDGSLYLVGNASNVQSAWPPGPPTYTYGPGGNVDIGIVHLSSSGSNLLSSALVGGNDIDYAGDIAINGSSIFVCGMTSSPTLSQFPITPSGYNKNPSGGNDAFLLRFSMDLSSYLNMTLIPGDSSSDGATSLAFDTSNNVYVLGTTISSTGYNGTAFLGPGGNYDLFVAKYDHSLSAQFYNVRIGGNSTEPTAGISYTSSPYSLYSLGYNGIIVDGGNRAWVTGMAASTNFPTTSGAFQTANNGNYDAFVLALNAAGTGLDCSTFIGGVSTDVGRGIRLDSNGNVYVAGSSASMDYPQCEPVQAYGGSYDIIVSVFSPDLSALLFSTYWGGSSIDYASDLVVGPAYSARVAGSVASGFPVIPEGSLFFGNPGFYEGAVFSLYINSSEALPVPTMTEWGIILFMVSAVLAALYHVRRNQDWL
jgi:hypothetical protein